MKRCVCILISLCLTFYLVPLTAHAESQLSTAQVSAQEAPSAQGQGVRDVEQVLAKTISTQARSVPAATDFHAAFGVDMKYGYPRFNENFDSAIKAAGGDEAAVTAQKAAVLAEDEALLDYTSMDEQGNLYKGGVAKTASDDGKTVTKLVRHTYGVNNYGKAIPDSAPATNKRLSLRMVRYGNVVTGLYAPPGEVVKITLESTSSDLPAENLGLQAFIGNFSGNTHNVEIPDSRNYVRMPKADKTLALDKQVNYVGSPFGGAILIYSKDIGGTTVQMTIEGAIEMPTYFYGQTSDEELARQLSAPGPYFAFSTPRGVRGVGPTTLLEGLTADQVKRAMEFWDKAIGLSYQFEVGGFDKDDPDTNVMVEMFEPYIPAGAAVNIGGAYCICPVSWGYAFLNGDTLMTVGAWGNIHELNHSFYWGGAADGSVEIANNVISSLTYQLYTNIAANRSEAGGLTDWNWCSDMFTTMENMRKNVSNWGTLGVYVPVQHAFGADAFINSVHIYHENGGKAGSATPNNPRFTNANVWLYATSKATGYDMTYYLRDVLSWRDGAHEPASLFPEYSGKQEGKSDYLTTGVIDEVKSKPVFIPSGCLYASGFVYGDKVVEQGRPFRIPYGKAKVLNFNPSTAGGFVSVANGEKVTLKGYTAPDHGTLAPLSGDPMKLRYTPDPAYLDATFNVTVELEVTKGSYAGKKQEVTYKVSLLQDTSQTGFTTSYYNWPHELSQYNDAVAQAVSEGVIERGPDSSATAAIAGFNTSGKEAAGRLAVTEGTLYLDKTGPVDLYARGNVSYYTCVAASADALPDALSAQSKAVKTNLSSYSTSKPATHIQVYVIPQGGEAPTDMSPYAAVVREGEPLYVRAYVSMPYDCSCHYRIGYLDGGSVKDFGADMLSKPSAATTPAIASYTTEKRYSYSDPAVQSTSLYDFQVVGDEGMTVKRAWDITNDRDLTNPENAYKATSVSRIVDNDLKTHFHGPTYGPYVAEFVFELPDGAASSPINTIRYKGHSDYELRGKVKDYEVYVGNDYDALLDATSGSELLVAKGTARQGYDYDVYNMIDFDHAAQGKYVRLVAKSAYPSNGQYYYAFSDLRVGYLESISGEGKIEMPTSLGSGWTPDNSTSAGDNETFVNTRSAIMATESATGTFTFTGTGVIMYSTKGPKYGAMSVKLDDGEAVKVQLNASKTLGQQPVFWKSGLDGNKQHTVTFSPASSDSPIQTTSAPNRINVEYFEVKDSGESSSSTPAAPKVLAIEMLDSTRYTYTGAEIKPSVTVTLDGANVTEACTITYEDNKQVGTATVTATLPDDGTGKSKTAYTAFEIVKATYDRAIETSFEGSASGYTFGQDAPLPTPTVSGGPAGGEPTFYHSTSPTGEGEPWSELTSTTLEPGAYYVWALVSSSNYLNAQSNPLAFTVSEAPSSGDDTPGGGDDTPGGGSDNPGGGGGGNDEPGDQGNDTPGGNGGEGDTGNGSSATPSSDTGQGGSAGQDGGTSGNAGSTGGSDSAESGSGTGSKDGSAPGDSAEPGIGEDGAAGFDPLETAEKVAPSAAGALPQVVTFPSSTARSNARKAWRFDVAGDALLDITRWDGDAKADASSDLGFSLLESDGSGDDGAGNRVLHGTDDAGAWYEDCALPAGTYYLVLDSRPGYTDSFDLELRPYVHGTVSFTFDGAPLPADGLEPAKDVKVTATLEPASCDTSFAEAAGVEVSADGKAATFDYRTPSVASLETIGVSLVDLAGRTDDGSVDTAGNASVEVMTRLAPIALDQVRTYPTTVKFTGQSVSDSDQGSPLTLDVYLKSGSGWVKRLEGLTPGHTKGAIRNLKPNKSYRYQVRAVKQLDADHVTTSVWTSGKITTGANVKPRIASVKFASLSYRVVHGTSFCKSYRLKVQLAKKIGHGSKGIMTTAGTYARGKGKMFTVEVSLPAGSEDDELDTSGTLRLRGCKSKAYGGFTRLSNKVNYKFR